MPARIFGTESPADALMLSGPRRPPTSDDGLTGRPCVVVLFVLVAVEGAATAEVLPVVVVDADTG